MSVKHKTWTHNSASSVFAFFRFLQLKNQSFFVGVALFFNKSHCLWLCWQSHRQPNRLGRPIHFHLVSRSVGFFSGCFGGPFGVYLLKGSKVFFFQYVLGVQKFFRLFFGIEKVDLIIVNTNLGKFLMKCLKFSSWWFQHIWKICLSNWKSSPKRGENKTYLKPPPSFFEKQKSASCWA